MKAVPGALAARLVRNRDGRAKHTPARLNVAAVSPRSAASWGDCRRIERATGYIIAAAAQRRAGRMANSRFEYVKNFELDDTLLPGCWIAIRLDGRGFTKFCNLHNFEKPNDIRALNLMNDCAKAVMSEFGEIRIAYGESDEYSFVIHKSCGLFGRRSSKLVSLVTSLFSATYAIKWAEHFPDTPLQSTPMFDGRAVCYPTDETMRDYLAWRQADTHINNQYNTCYWALVKSGKTPQEAQQILKGTQTGFKNDMLYNDFGINYNELPEMFKKGSVLIRAKTEVTGRTREDGTVVTRTKMTPCVFHCDIIGTEFWEEHPEVLG